MSRELCFLERTMFRLFGKRIWAVDGDYIIKARVLFGTTWIYGAERLKTKPTDNRIRELLKRGIHQ